MTDVQGRDQEAEAMYHVEVTRTVAVAAVNQQQAIQRAIERVSHLMIEEGEEFHMYFRYNVTGAEDMTPEDVDEAAPQEAPA